MIDSRLNKHKQEFLNQTFLPSPHSLAANELPFLIKYYQDKLNIKIYLNGTYHQSEEGKASLQQLKDNIQKDINNYKSDKKYICYFQKFWTKPGYLQTGPNEFYHIGRTFSSDFSAEYGNIYSNIKFLLTKNDEIKSDISDKDINELNAYISRNPSLQKKIDFYISTYISSLEQQKDNVWFNSKNCIKEIKLIQANLQTDEVVGYVFTQNNIQKVDHFEYFLIKKNEMIKPLHWYMGVCRKDDLHKQLVLEGFTLYVASVNNLVLNQAGYICPQADQDSCATLGMLYLKELLKNNAEQMKLSLCFSFICPNYPNYLQQIDIFIPAPQALRYSQSSLFNEILAAAITDTIDPIKVSHSNTSYVITTFKKLLIDSINDTCLPLETRKHNQSILKNYSEFSKAWLKEYDQMRDKRNLMNKIPFNVYLNYQTHMMELIAITTKLASASTIDGSEFFAEKYRLKGDFMKNAYFSFFHKVQRLPTLHQDQKEETASQAVKQIQEDLEQSDSVMPPWL